MLGFFITCFYLEMPHLQTIIDNFERKYLQPQPEQDEKLELEIGYA